MTKKRQQKTIRIPKFTTYAEEAKFWDTHDFTDYRDGFKPVEVRFAKKLSEGITIRFDRETLTALRMLARKKGLGPTTLARMWILEQLAESEKKQVPAGR